MARRAMAVVSDAGASACAARGSAISASLIDAPWAAAELAIS